MEGFWRIVAALAIFSLGWTPFVLWLSKKLIGHALARDLEVHRQQLQAEFREREIRFSAVHGRQVEGLADLFIALENSYGQLAAIIGVHVLDCTTPQPRMGLRLHELNAALDLFRRHQLYLDAALVERIQQFINEVRDVDLASDPIAYFREHRSSLRQRLRGIEEDFRRLLGPELPARSAPARDAGE